MDDLATLSDKQQIVEVITELFVATDERDWSRVIGCLAPQVLLDMSSLGGAPVARTFHARGQTAQQLLLGAYQALSRQIEAGTVKM